MRLIKKNDNSNNVNKRNNHRYSTTQSKKKKSNNYRPSRHLVSSNTAKDTSRSSSIHSLVQATTFLNSNRSKLSKMIATSVSPNTSQFGHNSSSNNKSFNSFKNNRNNNNINKNNNKNINKNISRQMNPGSNYQKKNNPIQMNRNNFPTQQSQHIYFNQNSQTGSFNSAFGFNAVSSLANMIQNSELTVNLTNNEPRLVIFNNNNISNNNNNNKNVMSLFNASLTNSNNYRETSKISNKPFHHSKQPQTQNRQQMLFSSDLIANNCNLNKNSHYFPFESCNYKNKTLASTSNTGYKHNSNANVVSTIPAATTNTSQRYSNRFKYVKSTSISHSATKNSAPYNTTQYIMFDYSRRRPHDQECPTEQNSFTDEWNMALAANVDQSSVASTLSSSRSSNPIPINKDSIIKVNYNEFSLDSSNMTDESVHSMRKQFSLSEQNLEKMDQDELVSEESMMQENQQTHERLPQLSSSL